MPDYLVPGVYVEEKLTRPAAIVPRSGDVTLFVGPTRRGQSALLAGSAPIRSLADFELLFGGDADLGYATSGTNHLFHAARAFFDEGGRQLQVARAMGASASAAEAKLTAAVAGAPRALICAARFTGEAGNATMLLRETRVPADKTAMALAPPGSLIAIGGGDTCFIKVGAAWRPAEDQSRAEISPVRLLANSPELLTLEVAFSNADDEHFVYPGLGFDRRHPRWLGEILAPHPADPRAAVYHPYGFVIGEGLNGLALHQAIFKGVRPDRSGVRSRRFSLTGGGDGVAPAAADYAQALRSLARDSGVSLLAAPGSSHYPQAQTIAAELIRFARTSGNYLLAILDPPPKLTPAEVLAVRQHWDSDRAIVYYPWVTVKIPGPGGRSSLLQLPPSGFVCGLYARSDRERGVWKAPANLALRSAAGLERQLSNQDHELLNPVGVNCLRDFRARGLLVWGARTLSSDPEWKYIAVRRYVDLLQASIEYGCRWVVFEPNDEPLWARLRAAVAAFLDQQWRQGGLMGDRPDQAFFVRCDRSTMTQTDIDDGRLVCLLGVALLRPAEFIVMRLPFETAVP